MFLKNVEAHFRVEVRHDANQIAKEAKKQDSLGYFNDL